jgi:hypothetical protein
MKRPEKSCEALFPTVVNRPRFGSYSMIRSIVYRRRSGRFTTVRKAVCFKIPPVSLWRCPQAHDNGLRWSSAPHCLGGLGIGRGRAHAKCSAPSGGGLTRKNQGPRCPPPRLLGPVLLGFPWKPANVYLPGSTMHPWRCIHNGTKVTTRIPRTCRSGCPPTCSSRNPLQPLSPSRLAPQGDLLRGPFVESGPYVAILVFEGESKPNS